MLPVTFFMKPFRTALNAVVSKRTLNFKAKILTIGSCFSDSIGMCLETHKVHVCINPFGTLYNPVSIHKALDYMIANKSPEKDTFTLTQGLNLNYDFHSSFSSPSKEELDEVIQEEIESAHDFLKETSTVIITYGTAFVYQRKDNNAIVANCHKVPAKFFTKRLLAQNEIVESFTDLHKLLSSFNPNIDIILTVSPVRHLKDTLELNSVSKSILRSCCHIISESHPNVSYFPSYEIMIDDLRDYRFYKSDMIHPTEEAEQYIWEEFKKCFFDEESLALFNKWDTILDALSHKPFHPYSDSHQLFIKQTLEKLETFRSLIPVDKEIEFLKNQLIVD